MNDHAEVDEFQGDRFDQETSRRFIGLLVERTKLSASRLATKAGIAPSTLTRIYPVPQVSNSLGWQTVRKLKDTYADVLGGQEPGHDWRRSSVREQHAPFDFGPRQAGIPLLQIAVTDASGTALDDTPLELLTGDLATPIGFLAPGPITVPADRTFAVYMPSDAMQPRFRPGETLFVDRVKPMDAGDDVLVEFATAGPPLFAIASVVARDRSTVQLLQRHYDAQTTIHRSQIARIYVIVGHLTR